MAYSKKATEKWRSEIVRWTVFIAMVSTYDIIS